MNSDRGVLLIGPRGAGKSSAGPLLAARLGLAFADCDEIVERETGRTIAELFAQRRFRAVEVATLARLLRGPPLVVASGGGAVLWPGLAQAAEDWRVVWLDADPAVLAQRIAAAAPGGPTRPSLTGVPAEVEIGRIARERRSLYRAVAWGRIDTGGIDSGTVAVRIGELLGKAGPAASEWTD